MLHAITSLQLKHNFNIKYCLLSLTLLFSIVSNAQLQADFIASNTSGCSPLVVSFTNTSRGISNTAKYQWDFGNSNSSTNKDAATTYTAEQSFIVTLTVTDNNVSSSKSMTINVFKSPTPQFFVNNTTGCPPFNATFTSTSSTGSGNTVYYYWDFGDGNTINGDTTSQIVNHKYTSTGIYTVKLQVKTNTGCATTLMTKPNLVNVQPKPLASYVRSKNFLCNNSGEAITFSNSTSVDQGIKYLWKFGDGTTSNEVSPTHLYIGKGTYSDSLIATNSTGCSDTFHSSTPIFSSTFKSDFVIPNSGLCTNNDIFFINNSNTLPDNSNWYFPGQPTPNIGINTNKSFIKAGIYSIKLVNQFGNCIDSITKKVTIIQGITSLGFTINQVPLCAGKTLVTLKDTAVHSSTLWNLQGSSDTIKSNPAQYTFSHDSTLVFSLTVSNLNGCKATIQKTIVVKHTPVVIKSKTIDPRYNTSGCKGLKVKFSAFPSDNIGSFLWSFGDSTFASDSAPTHTFDSVGKFPVELKYTTLDGCNDTAWLKNIVTYSKPAPAFTVTNQEVCGGTARFIDKTPKPVSSWMWYFGDSSNTRGFRNYSISASQNPIHSYFDTGYYDIKFIATNGTCSDSVTVQRYVHILAPIATIDSIKYTCSGARDSVVFWNYYKSVASGTWDFGDNSELLTLDTTIHFVTHKYPKTGTYRAILTTTYEGCTSKDTATVYILTKQNPILSANLSAVCTNDSIKVMIDTSTLAKNPSSIKDRNYYSIFEWQYGDSTIFTKGLTQQTNWYYSYLGMLKGLIQGKTNLRVITKSQNFGCLDTSNFINLKVKGPFAGYYINTPQDCFKHPLSFVDTSKLNFNVAIDKWIWNFGDGNNDTLTTNGNTSHSFSIPAKYPVSLKVIDKDGCFDVSKKGDTAMPSGPKADFSWSPNSILSGSTVSFINNTNTFENKKVNYSWTFFSEGIKDTTSSPRHIYNMVGTDSVQLIAVNPQNGCSDTIANSVAIKKVLAAFSIKSTYINNNTCPPMQALFTSRSINADKLSWNFGDGSAGKSISSDTFASHTYDEPGVYNVTLYTYKNNLPLDSTTQIIVVKGAYASVTSDLTHGCVPSTINIKASLVNTATVTWDFGDGTVIVNSPDSMITHQYTSVGNYTPHILLTDINGCNSSFPTQKPIFIDSLRTSFLIDKASLCDTGTVSFIPFTNCFSADSLRMPLKVHWSFGTGNEADTSNELAPSFTYKANGRMPVTQTITSAIGCIATFKDFVEIKPSAKSIISAPLNVCEGMPVNFSATPTHNGNIQWNWNFNNGKTSSLQNPLPQIFVSDKDSISHDTIQLITTLNDCVDTTYFRLTVYPNPRVNLVPKTKAICSGDTVKLIAHGGAIFKWNPSISSNTLATPIVSPKNTTTYTVDVTNKYGCTSSDTAFIKVTPGMKETLTYPKDTFVCQGMSIQLPVSGADSYVWLSDTTTLRNFANNSSSPIATPVHATTTYTFIASDKNGCAAETVNINVTTVPYPTLKTADAMTIATGSIVSLNASASSDVVSYHWSPSEYLSNPDAATPICSPKNNMLYYVTVANQFGCSAKDSISIQLSCSESLFAPTGFLPSSTSGNEIFYPKGQGVREIKFLRIYNRSGVLMFEKNHFHPNEKNDGWDGTYRGNKCPAEIYIYVMEAICDTGEVFEKKGTVVLIR